MPFASYSSGSGSFGNRSFAPDVHRSVFKLPCEDRQPLFEVPCRNVRRSDLVVEKDHLAQIAARRWVSIDAEEVSSSIAGDRNPASAPSLSASTARRHFRGSICSKRPWKSGGYAPMRSNRDSPLQRSSRWPCSRRTDGLFGGTKPKVIRRANQISRYSASSCAGAMCALYTAISLGFERRIAA